MCIARCFTVQSRLWCLYSKLLLSSKGCPQPPPPPPLTRDHKRRSNMTPPLIRRKEDTWSKIPCTEKQEKGYTDKERARSMLLLFKLDFSKRLMARKDRTATRDFIFYCKCSTTHNKHSLHNFFWKIMQLTFLGTRFFYAKESAYKTYGRPF